MARAKVSCTRSSASLPAQRRARRCRRRACGYSSVVNSASSMAEGELQTACRARFRAVELPGVPFCQLFRDRGEQMWQFVEDVAGQKARLRARGGGAIAGEPV